MRTTEGEASPFVSGVILAAGASVRMGQPKQLLLLGDRCLLQHVVDAAVASCLDEIILVLGHRATEIQAALGIPSQRSARVVVNPGYVEGQAASLRLGVHGASSRAGAVAILLGDQPGVTAALIDSVAAAFVAGDLPVARPVYVTAGGRRVPGHPVFLARRVWPELEQLRGDQGARSVLAAHPGWVLEVPFARKPPGDLDTWQDYREAVDAARARTIRER
jgi:CTP:molybdopterin cytidylyltransferase MocA